MRRRGIGSRSEQKEAHTGHTEATDTIRRIAMIYLRNISEKIIHLGKLPDPVMLLPDAQTPDEYETDKHFSDSEAIRLLIGKGMLELVDVRPCDEKPEQAEPEIKIVYE